MTYKQTFWRTLVVMMLMLLTMPLTIQAQFGGGNGTEASPYLIENPQHLRQLAADVNNGNSYEDVYFKQTQSFSCWIEPFTPIGGKYYTVTEEGQDKPSVGTRKFCGIYNGNGNRISDLNICPTEDFYGIGLFGELGYGAYVYDLKINNYRAGYAIQGWGNCGAIAGSVNSDAYIVNCHVEDGVVVQVDPESLSTSNNDFGGIAGESLGKIWNCTSRATVTDANCSGVQSLGGIVGYNNGEVYNCIAFGSVNGSTKVGGIAGEARSAAIFDSNYFHTSGATGGVNGADVDGATWIGTISFSGGTEGEILSSPTYIDGGTNYFASGTTCVLRTDIKIDGGYIPIDPQLTSEQVTIGDDTWSGTPAKSFTFPQGQDVVIGCTYSALKRDISYSQWVEIDIPEQKYTGMALTPIITVIDKKTDTPVTLTEGTHYTVTLPTGDMIDAGHYPVTITGIGDFAGTATADFIIFNSSWFGEGTEESPYQIQTADDWLLLADKSLSEDFTGTCFILTKDLDFSETAFRQVGCDDFKFNGVFDGNGKTIDNAVMDEADGSGLFCWLNGNAVVKNLTSGSGNVFTARISVGGIAARITSAQIINCINYATVSAVFNQSAPITSGRYAGGIVGYTTSGSVTNCRNHGTVTAKYGAGGIVGVVQMSTISDNLNFARIEAEERVGAISGNNTYGNHSNNYYSGECNVGGLIGNDVAGQAMRGYTISGGDEVDVELPKTATIGVAYNNMVYAGNEQQVILKLSRKHSSEQRTARMEAPANTTFVASAGTLTDNNDGTWTLTMPEGEVTISIYAPPTGITHLEHKQTGKGTRYNLMGQPVGSDYKGIVIENGRKIIVR